ncbi:MAG: insulinase family protein, partial [Bacteroidota bacterium]
MQDRTTTPALIKPDEIKIPEAEKIILDNGIPLYMINAGEQDVIKIEIIFKAGASEHKKFLIAGATNELLDEGTKHHSAAEIAEEFEFYGAVLHSESSADWASVSLITLNKFLEKVFPLCHEVISEPVFPEHEIETYKIQNKQRLQVNNNKVDYVARKTFNQKLFGQNSAYGFYQNVEDYEMIEKNTLLNFHKTNYLNGVFAIVVSGRVGEVALKLINSHFGTTKNVAGENNATSKNYNQETGKFFTDKKDAVQSGLRIGKKLFNKTHPDYKALSILNTIL